MCVWICECEHMCEFPCVHVCGWVSERETMRLIIYLRQAGWACLTSLGYDEQSWSNQVKGFFYLLIFFF